MMEMIAITTSHSISVNAPRRPVNAFISALLIVGQDDVVSTPHLQKTNAQAIRRCLGQRNRAEGLEDICACSMPNSFTLREQLR